MTQPTNTDQTPLTAIQQGYEEARASIIDPTGAPLNWIHDPANPHPATEEIDVDAVPPPVPHDATPATETMSVAARQLAEQGLPGQAAALAPTSPGAAGLTRLQRWWRAFWTP